MMMKMRKTVTDMQVDKILQDRFKSVTYKVDIPEGALYFQVLENNNGEPIGFDIHLGKAGSMIMAWAKSLARMMTIAIEHGATLEDLMQELSSQNSDKIRRRTDGVNIRSGPDGICYALHQYRSEYYKELRIKTGIGDDDGETRKNGGKRFRPR